jgi:hypothetical protein
MDGGCLELDLLNLDFRFSALAAAISFFAYAAAASALKSFEGFAIVTRKHCNAVKSLCSVSVGQAMSLTTEIKPHQYSSAFSTSLLK